MAYLSKSRHIFRNPGDGRYGHKFRRVIRNVLDLYEDSGRGRVDATEVGSIRGQDLELIYGFLFVIRIADELDNALTIVTTADEEHVADPVDLGVAKNVNNLKIQYLFKSSHFVTQNNPFTMSTG